MRNSLKEDLRAYLKNNLNNCPDIFINFSPENNINFIRVDENPTNLSKISFDYGFYSRQFQITIKEDSMEKAEDLAYEVFYLLNSGITEEEKLLEFTSKRKVICRPKQLPFFLKKTNLGKTFYTFNLTISSLGR